jgi:L-methionine (R)-S-oxide reductase
MDGPEKSAVYAGILRDLDAVLAGVTDDVTAMAICACLLHSRLPYASWTGFYRVVAPQLLRIGPFQGPLGCLEIPFDRGVCGAAASSRTTLAVADVHLFPGHIACDAAARSEIVVPILDRGGELIAVLDIDSHQPAAFDEHDRAGLERIAGHLQNHLASAQSRAAPPAGGDN